MLSSSPPRSAARSSFAFTSSPAREEAGLLSSVASSPPPATPHDSPRHLNPFKKALAISARSSVLPSAISSIEYVNLEASNETITITIGETVHIGRKLKKLEQKLRDDDAYSQGAVKLVTIPKAAKHASRHHCSLTLSRSNDGDLSLDIEVLGQNGMQLQGVKIPTGNKTLRVGEGETVLLGFYTDFSIKAVCKAKVDAGRHVIPQTTAHPKHQQADEQLPPVPTSEATLGLDLEMDLEDEDDEEAEAEGVVDAVKPSFITSANTSASRRSSISMSSSVPSSPVSVTAYNKRRRASRESSHQPAVKRARFSSEVRSSPAPSPYAHQDDDGYPPEDSSESEDEEALERRKEGE